MYLLSPNMYFLIILKLQNLIVENDYKFRKKFTRKLNCSHPFFPFLLFSSLPPSFCSFIHAFVYSV